MVTRLKGNCSRSWMSSIANFYAILQSGTVKRPDKTAHNGSVEHSGRLHKVTLKQTKKMERILQGAGIETRSMSWAALAYEADIKDVISRTALHVLGSLNYYKCTACRPGWASRISAKTLRIRRTYARPWSHTSRLAPRSVLGWGSLWHRPNVHFPFYSKIGRKILPDMQTRSSQGG